LRRVGLILRICLGFTSSQLFVCIALLIALNHQIFCRNNLYTGDIHSLAIGQQCCTYFHILHQGGQSSVTALTGSTEEDQFH
ncbi:hypothetical protein FGF02_01010, partial [Aeromonas salmonicida subsp. achromogenes]|uniref:hypothetical protein n=1 Tax=Aeromonas salmonicida TaxID=645 RepID=UPI001BB0FBBE